MKMEQCSETSAYKIQTPGNYPEKTYNRFSSAGSEKIEKVEGEKWRGIVRQAKAHSGL
jgi:hypothetical protein